MESLILLWISLAMFAVSGLLFVAAIQKYTHAARLLTESRELVKRATLLKGGRR